MRENFTVTNQEGTFQSVYLKVVIRPGLSHNITWKRVNTVQSSPGVLNFIFLCLFFLSCETPVDGMIDTRLANAFYSVKR